MSRELKVVLGGWILVLTMASGARAGAGEQPAVLEDVVITATRTPVSLADTPQSVLVIEREDLAAAGWRLDEALDRLPGVIVNRAGSRFMATLPTIRGSQPGEVLVLLNGRRLNAQQSGWYNLSDLPVPGRLIERVEVLPDSSSALYGAEAMGGVINIITREPRALPAVSLSGSAGSHGDRGAEAGLSGGIGPLGLAASMSRDTSRGWRANSDGAATRANLYASLAGENGVLDFTADFLRQRLGSPGLEQFPTPLARQADNASLMGLRYHHQAGDRISLDAEASFQQYLREYTDPEWDTRSRHRTRAGGVALRGTWDGGAFGRWTAGGELGWDSLESTNDGDRGLSRESFYLQDELRPLPAWSVVATGRYDRFSVFDDQVSPRLALVWRAAEWATLRGSVARGYRTPTFDDLYWSDAYSRGNPDLEPERSWSYEVSAAGRAARTGWGMDLFLRDVADLINWRDADGDWVYSPENIAAARITGATVSLSQGLGGGAEADLSYTFLHPEDRDTGELIGGRPRHQVKAALRLPCGCLETGFGVAWIDRYPAPNLEDESYWTSSLRLAHTLATRNSGKFVVAFTVDNVFNQGYQVTAGYPMPGREIGLRVSWEY